jgi:hypothetical protein
VNAERISMGLMYANQQVTIREVLNEVGISYGSAQAIRTMQQFLAGKINHTNAKSTIFTTPCTQ